jgi:hypothetical protein
MMRLCSTDRREKLIVRTYLHPIRGLVRTLAMACEPNVIHVGGPNFGAGERIATSPAEKPIKSKRRRAGR